MAPFNKPPAEILGRDAIMQRRAANNPDKGRYLGDCNRTQCQAPGARWWNRGSRAYYCEECALMLNRANPMDPPLCEEK